MFRTDLRGTCFLKGVSLTGMLEKSEVRSKHNQVTKEL